MSKNDVDKKCKKSKCVMKLENICKNYKMKDKDIKVLNSVSVEFENNTFYAIKGHSGSGKSTLVNILGLVDKFDSGLYELYGTKIEDFTDKELSYLRMKNIGFVFQEFHLNPTLKAFENVMVPMLINKSIAFDCRKEIAIKLLRKVGLGDRLEHFPHELSGGEQQRVAIARALANDPSIILADEPTGNLDESNEKEIFNLLKKLSENEKCIVVVSHSECVKKYAQKIYTISSSGELVGDTNEF